MRDDGRFGETEPTGGGGEVEGATAAADESVTAVLPAVEAEAPVEPRVDIPEWVSEIRRLYVEPKHPVLEEEGNARHRRTSFVRRGRRARAASETPAVVVPPAAQVPAPAEEDHVPRGLAALAGFADEPSPSLSASHAVEPDASAPETFEAVVHHDPTVDEEQAASRLTAYLDVSSAARLHGAHPVDAPDEPVAEVVVEPIAEVVDEPVLETSGAQDAADATDLVDEAAVVEGLGTAEFADVEQVVDLTADIEIVPDIVADVAPDEAVVADLAAAPELVPPVMAASELLPPVPAAAEPPAPVLHDPGLRFDGPDADEAMIAEAAAAMRRTEVADLEEAWRRPTVDPDDAPAEVVADDSLDEAAEELDAAEVADDSADVESADDVVVAPGGPDVADQVAHADEREVAPVADVAPDGSSAEADVEAVEDEPVEAVLETEPAEAVLETEPADGADTLLESDDTADVDAAGLDVTVPSDLWEDIERDGVDAAGLDAPSDASQVAPEMGAAPVTSGIADAEPSSDDEGASEAVATLPAPAVAVAGTSARPEAPAPVDPAVVTMPPAEDEPAPGVAAAASAPVEDDQDDDLVYHPPPVHLSWRQADSLDFEVPSVDDPTNDILIEAPSQLVAPPRRRNDPAARLQREEAARQQRDQEPRAQPTTVATSDHGSDDSVATRASMRAAAREESPRGRAGKWVALAAVALVVVIAAVWFMARDSGSDAAAAPLRAATVTAVVAANDPGSSLLGSAQG